MTVEKTPAGTSVGVENPYEYVDRCDHLTDDGRCRLAIERPWTDPEFAETRRQEAYRCHVIGDSDTVSDSTGHGSGPPVRWDRCRHFRCRNREAICVRCGLEERRIAHADARPLLEEHHLSYADDTRTLGHEITVPLCRWCHAKVHRSWARLDDEVSPSSEAIAAKEGRRTAELAECEFPTAAERYGSTD